MAAPYRVYSPLVERYEPVYGVELPIEERAPLSRVPENIFTSNEIDGIVKFWATVRYESRVGGSGPFLIPVPPETLVTAYKGDNFYATLLPERVPGHETFGMWRPIPGSPGKVLYATRIGGPDNNYAVPCAKHDGNRKHKDVNTPIWQSTTVIGETARARWKQQADYPAFPWESGSNSRMTLNIGRVLWRFYYNSYIPLGVYDVSHLAAQAAFDAVQNPTSPYFNVGLVALELSELNEWRKSCNRYGLWRMKYVPGFDTPQSEEILRSGPILGGCIHAVIGLQPCYGPVGDLTENDPIEPTGLTPARVVRHGGRKRKEGFKGPFLSPFGDGKKRPGGDDAGAEGQSGAKSSKKGGVKAASFRAAAWRMVYQFTGDPVPGTGEPDQDALAVWEAAMAVTQQRIAAAGQTASASSQQGDDRSREISPYGASPSKPTAM